MREIIFRGKKLNDGEWVCGSLVTTERGAYMAPPGEEAKLMFGSSKVDSKTIGQYTGIDDINSKKIFEGDIVLDQTDDEEIGDIFSEVVFYKGAFMLTETGYEPQVFLCDECHLEVVGNVYDNPELLEAERWNS